MFGGLAQLIDEAKYDYRENQNPRSKKIEVLVKEGLPMLYEDIDEVQTAQSIRPTIDFFLFTQLVWERKEDRYDTVNYIGEILASFISAENLVPIVDEGENRRPYTSDIFNFTSIPPGTLFQIIGDWSLVMTGLFPKSFRRRSKGLFSSNHDEWAILGIEIYNGKAAYGRASNFISDNQPTFRDLCMDFEYFRTAINEIADQFIDNKPHNLIVNCMLDMINRFRETDEFDYLNRAKRYAELIGEKLDM